MGRRARHWCTEKLALQRNLLKGSWGSVREYGVGIKLSVGEIGVCEGDSGKVDPLKSTGRTGYWSSTALVPLGLG